MLDNACKYRESGGRIDTKAARDGDEAVIRVRDSGMGIRPEMLARVFEPFRSTARSNGRRAASASGSRS